jgi:hypothetical protein
MLVSRGGHPLGSLLEKSRWQIFWRVRSLWLEVPEDRQGAWLDRAADAARESPTRSSNNCWLCQIIIKKRTLTILVQARLLERSGTQAPVGDDRHILRLSQVNLRIMPLSEDSDADS